MHRSYYIPRSHGVIRGCFQKHFIYYGSIDFSALPCKRIKYVRVIKNQTRPSISIHAITRRKKEMVLNFYNGEAMLRSLTNFSAIRMVMVALQVRHVPEHEWRKVKVVREFLEEAACRADEQFASTKATLSLSSAIYQGLQRKCQSAMKGDGEFLVNVSQHIGAMLEKYEQTVCSSLAMLCKALDTTFKSYVVADMDVVRIYVDKPSVTVPQPPEKEKKSLFDVILDGNSANMGYDEFTKFFRAPSRGDCRLYTLDWCAKHAKSYSSLSIVARGILAIQASLVAAESAFSKACHLINDLRSTTRDESIRACMVLKSSWGGDAL